MTDIQQPAKECSGPNEDASGSCGRPAYAHAGSVMVCQAHHRQYKKHGSLRPIRRGLPPGTSCTGPGWKKPMCDRNAEHWDLTTVPHAPLCKGHYVQRRAAIRLGMGGLRPIKPTRKKYPSTVRDADGRKRCCVCEQWLDQGQFGPAGRTADKLSPHCKPCGNVLRRMRSFGLSAKRFKEMIALQGNSCAICRRTFDDINIKVCVDHDHACCAVAQTCGMCIRGLLCNNCNSSLGWFKDSVKSITAAIGYLEDWKASRLPTTVHAPASDRVYRSESDLSERTFVVGAD